MKWTSRIIIMYNILYWGINYFQVCVRKSLIISNQFLFNLLPQFNMETLIHLHVWLFLTFIVVPVFKDLLYLIIVKMWEQKFEISYNCFMMECLTRKKNVIGFYLDLNLVFFFVIAKTCCVINNNYLDFSQTDKTQLSTWNRQDKHRRQLILAQLLRRYVKLITTIMYLIRYSRNSSSSKELNLFVQNRVVLILNHYFKLKRKCIFIS